MESEIAFLIAARCIDNAGMLVARLVIQESTGNNDPLARAVQIGRGLSDRK